MLSRSNSNAGERLRRAKSTSSAHTTSSGNQRSSTSIDPFVVRQHAETAAVEAFQRAKYFEEPAVLQAYRPVPPKLQRRRSQVSGKAEGSHFEDARLGRRNSAKAKKGRDENCGPSSSKAVKGQQYGAGEAPMSMSMSEGSESEVVVTRKRSVIPPSSASAPRYSLFDHSSAVSSDRKEKRKSQTTHTDGSPAPRHTTSSQRGSAGYPLTSLSHRPMENHGYVAGVNDHERMAQSPKPSIRETQTDDEIIALAQDHCPPASQSNKLRERKSFIFAPFQRRRATNAHKSSDNSYDTVLPPFNYADEGLPPPPPLPPPLPIYTAPPFTIDEEKKGRTFSDSLKGRFKKVFRKATRVPTVIPAQHVEATHPYFSVTTPLSTPTVQLEEPEDPFMVGTANDGSHLTVPEVHSGSVSRHSSGEQSAAKSRVTSWTNSTVAGTWSTCDDVENHDTADEQGRLKRSGSTSTLKKARSFFGRPVKNKLRRPSRLNLQGSEESAGLYSALQDRIKPADSASQIAASNNETQSVRVGSALDTLPSRQRADSTVSSRGGGWQASTTIRSVTPDPTAYRLDIPSPVAEVCSPEVARPRSRQDDSHEELTPRSQLQRRPAMKAPTPSKEQIERRIERCKNRWQSPLDELSPSAPRPSRHNLEENPYEMRSLSRTLHQSVANDLPHHARVGEQQPASGRPDVLSPSVYSRATDGESPRSNTPTARGGMIVTITGREAKSYAISPSKIDQPAERAVHASQEWRRWLSDEMNGWDGSSAPQDFNLSKDAVKDTPAAHEDAFTQQMVPSQRTSSATPALEPLQTQVKTREVRPRPSSRLSSYMNDRYPMIDTGRNSSDQSIGRRSRISSRADSRPGTSESNARPTTVQDKMTSAEGKSLKSALARQRVVTKPRSIAQLSALAIVQAQEPKTSGDDTVIAPVNAEKHLQDSNATTVASGPTQSKRPKSAFDLRANYKTSFSTTSRPLEVRRKTNASDTHNHTANHNILEDSTILNISAGPYAGPSQHVHDDKENFQPHPASEPIAISNLPALSSSEWLAAGTNKKKERDVQNLSQIHPAYRSRQRSGGSRYSPSRSRGGTPASAGGGEGGGGSPGHRLATSWLDGKRMRVEEGSPVGSAFV